MATPTAPDPSGRRPAFREGQLLDAPALRAEQQARIASLTRHEAQVHTPDEGTLRAHAVTDPAGGSRIVLSGGPGQLLSAQLADGKGGFREAGAVRGDGAWHAAGPATVSGPLTAGGPAALRGTIPAPQGAAPWSMYRTTLAAPGKSGTEQLRLETGEVRSGDDPTAVQTVIASGGDTWASLLQVDANGTVTIPGCLRVTGDITIAGGGSTLANTDLVATNQGVSDESGQVSYILQLATSAATAVTSIAVYQTVLSGGSVASRTTVAQGVNLQPASSTTFTESLPGGHVTVDVLAIGVGQDGLPRSATLSFTT